MASGHRQLKLSKKQAKINKQIKVKDCSVTFPKASDPSKQK